MMGTKKFLTFISVLGFILVLVSPAYEAAFQQTETAEGLYESAVFKKDVDGDLRGAIELFEKILAQFPNSRKVAAKAQLQIGICSEKLGMDEAKKAYQSVIAEFADQKDEVSEAQSRLKSLEKLVIPQKKQGYSIRHIWEDSSLGDRGAPSPDGKYYSYLDWDTGDLGIIEIANGKKRLLTNNSQGYDYDEMVWNSCWSSDGKHIVYDWGSIDFKEIRIIGLDGLPPRTIYHFDTTLQSNEEAEVRSAHIRGWTANGKYVIVEVFKTDDSRELSRIEVKSGVLRTLKNFDTIRPRQIILSPDSRFILYDAPTNGTNIRDIFLLSIDGKQDIPIIQHPANDYPICWSWEYDQIYFVSDRTGSTDLWSITIHEGKIQENPKLIIPQFGDVSASGLTKNGSLFFTRSKSLRDTFVAEINPKTNIITSPPKKISNEHEGTVWHADFSPDGKYLAYISRKIEPAAITSTSIIHIRSLETGEERELLTNLGSILYPRWSPNSQTLLVNGYIKGGSSGIFQIDSKTGDNNIIVTRDRSLANWPKEWSNDGKSIYFVRFFLDQENKENILGKIIKRNLETQKEFEILQLEGPEDARIAISISPDEKWIAYVNWFGRGKINLIPIDGGRPTLLYEAKDYEHMTGSICWTPDGKNIVFTKGKQEDKQGFWRIPIDGGDPIKMGLNMPMQRFMNLSIHPNGDRIVFYIASFISDMFVMENFMESTKK